MEEGYDMWELTWDNIVDLCIEAPGMGLDKAESNKENVDPFNAYLGDRVSRIWDGNEY
jgi:hypothetical protein